MRSIVQVNLSDLILNLQIPRIDDVYYPSDDSYLVIDYVDTPEFEKLFLNLSESKNEIKILDMGCGTGILGFCTTYKLISTGFCKTVHLTYADVNQKAIEVTKFMVNENYTHLKNLNRFKSDNVIIDYYESDLFDKIPSQLFDIILFNPPYLPQDEEITNPKPIDQALYGGPEGISVLNAFFSTLKTYITTDSHVFFITSTLGALHKLLPCLSKGYHIMLLQNIHTFFEDFGLFHAKEKPKNTNKV